MVDYRTMFNQMNQHPYDNWITDHMGNLYNITKAMGAKKVIELGVHYGHSTISFLTALNELGGKLWSCDINPPEGMIKQMLDTPLWTFTLGDDLDFAEDAPWADIIFIDTNHEFRHTQSELQLYSQDKNDGGIFILHDTYNLDCLGVFAAAIQYADDWGAHFYNYEYGSGLGIIGRDFSKIEHLFGNRGKMWL